MFDTDRLCRLSIVVPAGDGIEAVRKASDLKPRLVLLDLNMPRLNDVEAATQIAHFSLDSAVLFVSMNNSADIVSEALSTGAKGYILKINAATELWPAIEAVLEKKLYLSGGPRETAFSAN